MATKTPIVLTNGEIEQLQAADQIAVVSVNIIPTAGDIASPNDGDLWYNSTTGKFRQKQNGVISDWSSSGSGSSLGVIYASEQGFMMP